IREQVRRDSNVPRFRHLVRHTARPVIQTTVFVNQHHHWFFLGNLRVHHPSVDRLLTILYFYPLVMTRGLGKPFQLCRHSFTLFYTSITIHMHVMMSMFYNRRNLSSYITP